jgi:hypothetical protein
MTMTMEATKTFKVGDELACRSMCDYDCIYRFKVVSRTAKFVTLEYYGELKRTGIKIDRDGDEYTLPFGSYSMAAMLRAGETA